MHEIEQLILLFLVGVKTTRSGDLGIVVSIVRSDETAFFISKLSVL